MLTWDLSEKNRQLMASESLSLRGSLGLYCKGFIQAQQLFRLLPWKLILPRDSWQVSWSWWKFSMERNLFDHFVTWVSALCICHAKQKFHEYPQLIPLQYGFWHCAWACWGTQGSDICHSNSLCRLIPWLPLLCLPCSIEMCSHMKVPKASMIKYRRYHERGNIKVTLFEVCFVSCLLCVPLAEHGRVFASLDYSFFIILDILLLTYFKVTPSNERVRKSIRIYSAP